MNAAVPTSSDPDINLGNTNTRTKEGIPLFVKIVLLMFIFFLAVFGAYVGYNWSPKHTAWGVLTVLFLLSWLATSVSVYLIMKADSGKNEVGGWRVVIGLLILLAVGACDGHMMLPRVISDEIGNVFGQGADSPHAIMDGKLIKIEFEDGSGNPRKPSKVIVTAEYAPGDKIDLNDWDTLYIFFQEEGVKGNTKAYRIVKKKPVAGP